MLDPSGLRVVLLELELVGGDGAGVAVVDDEPGAGRPLVDRRHVHLLLLPLPRHARRVTVPPHAPEEARRETSAEPSAGGRTEGSGGEWSEPVEQARKGRA